MHRPQGGQGPPQSTPVSPWFWTPSVQVPAWHAPAWHVPPGHGEPSGSAGLEQAPVDGSQVPAAWHASSAAQGTVAVPSTSARPFATWSSGPTALATPVASRV